LLLSTVAQRPDSLVILTPQRASSTIPASRISFLSFRGSLHGLAVSFPRPARRTIPANRQIASSAFEFTTRRDSHAPRAAARAFGHDSLQEDYANTRTNLLFDSAVSPYLQRQFTLAIRSLGY
jgi:hypothetical protein